MMLCFSMVKMYTFYIFVYTVYFYKHNNFTNLNHKFLHEQILLMYFYIFKLKTLYKKHYRTFKVFFSLSINSNEKKLK